MAFTQKCCAYIYQLIIFTTPHRKQQINGRHSTRTQHNTTYDRRSIRAWTVMQHAIPMSAGAAQCNTPPTEALISCHCERLRRRACCCWNWRWNDSCRRQCGCCRRRRSGCRRRRPRVPVENSSRRSPSVVCTAVDADVVGRSISAARRGRRWWPTWQTWSRRERRSRRMTRGRTRWTFRRRSRQGRGSGTRRKWRGSSQRWSGRASDRSESGTSGGVCASAEIWCWPQRGGQRRCRRCTGSQQCWRRTFRRPGRTQVVQSTSILLV